VFYSDVDFREARDQQKLLFNAFFLLSSPTANVIEIRGQSFTVTFVHCVCLWRLGAGKFVIITKNMTVSKIGTGFQPRASSTWQIVQ